MKLSPKKIQSVLSLSGPERFEHFVKVIADWQQVWSLYEDAWALAATDEGIPVFPLWPAREYAQLCATDEWKGYEPRRIALEELTDVLLPKLQSDGVLPGVFMTPSDKGVTPSIEELQAAIQSELSKY